MAESLREWLRGTPQYGNAGLQWTLGRYRLGRFQVFIRLYRHIYPTPDSPDRWVFHPQFVYDRKRRNP